MPAKSDQPRRTLLLTGASRGIGHATVKRFSSAGWRVITCSRHAFPEECPWEAGPEDHIQVDLASPEATTEAIAEIKRRLARASVCRRGLRDFEGGARIAHARDGRRLRPARHSRERDRARRD
jgi:NAD(P)-dependent dehydrogenase (short-subunit alcohol dehydrogenase family)